MQQTTSALEFNTANGHIVRDGAHALLLHVPSTAVFGIDAIGLDVLEACGRPGGRTAGELAEAFGERYTPERVHALVEELRQLEILQPKEARNAINPAKVAVKAAHLSTLVLNVNTGCNLACTYCYKEDLAVPARGRRMDFATAAKSVDLLLEQGAGRRRVSIVFFGGEPLTNVPLIRQVVDYAEARVRDTEQSLDFSMTTNATLLKDELIDWLDTHRFGISVSIDGPQEFHDRHRRSVGGKPTYALVERKVRSLLSRYRSRPVGARVTLGAGVTDVEAIHAHLKGALGFHEVGFAPVTGSEANGLALSAAELLQVHEAFERLGTVYRDEAIAGRNNGFSNMHQLMADLHEGRRKSLPCGAGVGLLAVDADGDLNLCHRFTGSELPTFGSVHAGIDTERLNSFVEKALDRDGTHCATCRIRNLCSGGCYHESYVRYGDPHHPTYHYCSLLRRWVDFGIGIYGAIQRQNPSFFTQYLEPRSARE